MIKEIEDLKNEVDRLKHENRLYKNIVEQLPVGIQVFDKNGFSYAINTKQKTLLGLPDLHTGIGKFNVLTDDYVKASGVAPIYQKAYQGTSYSHVFEYNLGIDQNKWDTRKDTRVFHERIIPIIGQNNTVEFVVALLEDLTEEKKAEKELLAVQNNYKSFVEHSPDIIYKFSNTRGALFWSNKVKEILGFEPDELQKKPFLWTHSIHPDDQQKVKQAILDFEKGADYSIEYRVKTKQGKWIWLHDFFMFKTQMGNEIIIEGHATDITKQKELEIELKQIQERFDLAMAATNDGLWDWNLKTNDVYFSPNWKKMLGYTENELPNSLKTWEQLLHPDDLNEAYRLLDKHFKSETQRYDIEFRMKHKQGHWVDVLSRGHALYNSKGEAYRIVGTHVDISERKEIRKQLQDSQLRWKFAIEGNKDGLWDWNLRTDEVFFSKQWKKMLGFQENEIQGSLKEWEKRVHPEDQTKVYEDIQKHLSGKQKYYQNEHRVLCKDGSYKWVLDRGIVVEWDQNKKPLRMIGTHSDISKRKKAEQSIKESQIKFKTIFEILDVGLNITDEQGNIIDCNHASEKILGLSRNEQLTRNFAGKEWTIVRPDNSPMSPDEFASVRAMKLNKAIRNAEMGVIVNGGKTTWISVNATPLNLEGYGVLIAYVDITNIKDNNQKLTELNATKDKFFSIIAHDLRSPFSGILGLSEMALKKIRQKQFDKIEKYLTVIQDSTKQSLNLLENLLQWSRIQTGNIVFVPNQIQVDTVINNTLSASESLLKEKHIGITINVPYHLEAFADHFMLETILRNLLSNAVKYSKPDGTIIISAEKHEKFVKFTIQDNGIGISPENLTKLFRIETNFSTRGTHDEKGTGLGLILSKEFVEKQGGKIWAESTIGQGSSFMFTIPLYLDQMKLNSF